MTTKQKATLSTFAKNATTETTSPPDLSPDRLAFLLFPALARRMAAYLIDVVIVGLVSFMLLNLVLFATTGSAFASSLANFGRGAGSYALLLLLTNFVYHVAMERQSKYRGTIGKLCMGLQVVDRQGLSLTTGQAIARSITRLIPVMSCGLLYFVAMHGGQGRSLHDRLSKTVVIVRHAGQLDVAQALSGRRGLSIMDWLCVAAAMYLFFKVSLPLMLRTLLHVFTG